MRDFSPAALVSFTHCVDEELAKEADAKSMLGGAGALGGLGLAGGALLGGAHKGVKAYREARDQGQSVGGAALSGLGGAAQGAQKGALIGGAAGLGLGAAAGHLRPELMGKARTALSEMKGPVGGASRFGQRQVHALTGWKPGESNSSIRSIGAGTHDAGQRAQKAEGALRSAVMGGKGGPEVSKSWKGLQHASKAYDAADAAEQHGLTSLPGYAKSVKERGLLPTAATGFKEQWHSMSPAWKAMMIGAPLAETATALTHHEHEGQPGRGEVIGRGLANAAVGATMGSIPMATSSLLLAPAASRAAGLVGRGVDKLRGKSRQEYSPLETSGQISPLERQASPEPVTGGTE